MGGGGRAGRQHEGFQRFQVGVEAIYFLLQPLHLGIDDAQRLVAQVLAGVGGAQVGAEVEHVVLYALENGVEFGERRVGGGRQPARPMAALASSTVP